MPHASDGVGVGASDVHVTVRTLLLLLVVSLDLIQAASQVLNDLFVHERRVYDKEG